MGSAATMEILSAMQRRLESAGIPHESIHVFGTIRCNVHVICAGRDTADKWAALLGGIFKGAKVNVGDHLWTAAKNKGLSMSPTMRRGYLVAVAA